MIMDLPGLAVRWWIHPLVCMPGPAVRSSTGQSIQFVNSGVPLDWLTAEALQDEVARKAPDKYDARCAAADKDRGQDKYQRESSREERTSDCRDDGEEETGE
jgi:hypothetical protein